MAAAIAASDLCALTSYGSMKNIPLMPFLCLLGSHDLCRHNDASVPGLPVGGWVWVDGWMDGWIGVWIDGWVDR